MVHNIGEDYGGIYPLGRGYRAMNARSLRARDSEPDETDSDLERRIDPDSVVGRIIEQEGDDFDTEYDRSGFQREYEFSHKPVHPDNIYNNLKGFGRKITNYVKELIH